MRVSPPCDPSGLRSNHVHDTVFLGHVRVMVRVVPQTINAHADSLGFFLQTNCFTLLRHALVSVLVHFQDDELGPAIERESTLEPGFLVPRPSIHTYAHMLCCRSDGLGAYGWVDAVRQVSSNAGYLMSQLLQQHRAMSMVVAREVEGFLFRSGLPMRARYCAIVFLNQLSFSHREQDQALAARLINAYFGMFKVNTRQTDTVLIRKLVRMLSEGVVFLFCISS